MFIFMIFKRDAMHSEVFAVLRCPSVRPSRWCIVCVETGKLNLPSNFFIAWWPYNSSFPTGDPTMKFRQGHPNRGAK